MIEYIKGIATNELSSDNVHDLKKQAQKYGNDTVKEVANNNVGILDDTNYKIFLSDLKKQL